MVMHLRSQNHLYKVSGMFIWRDLGGGGGSFGVFLSDNQTTGFGSLSMPSRIRGFRCVLCLSAAPHQTYRIYLFIRWNKWGFGCINAFRLWVSGGDLSSPGPKQIEGKATKTMTKKNRRPTFHLSDVVCALSTWTGSMWALVCCEDFESFEVWRGKKI